MKRHISIFAFLLCAFAAVGTAVGAGTWVINGGYYYIEGTFGNISIQRMSIDGKPNAYTAQNVPENTPAAVTFRAYPDKGTEIADWGRYVGNNSAAIMNPSMITWTGRTSETYPWETGEKSGQEQGYLAVRFDYIRFIVTFDTNGGTPTPIKDMEKQTIVSTINLPSVAKEGYKFAGWKNEKDKVFKAGNTRGEAFWNDDDRKFYADLTAQWTTNKYMVTFDANGGDTPVPTTKEVTYDSPYGELATCTRAGYTFNGWYTTAKEGGVQITAGSPVRITENQTLYARWTAIEYDVELVLNGGKFPEGDKPLKITTEVDKVFSVAAPERENWVFAGWTVVKVPEESSYDGAKWGTEPDETENDVMDKTTKCQNGARGAVYFKNLTFDSNVQVFLKATWQGQERQIRTTASPAEAGTTVPEEMTYTEGDKATLRADSNDGWSFKCWQLDGQDVSDQNPYSFTVSGDADYVAVFTGKVYTVKFQNSGEKKAPTKQVTFGQPYGDLPVFTDEKLVLEGWYTEDEGQGTKIFPTTIVTEAGNHDLYANWIPKTKFDVVWRDLEGGNAWVTNQDVSVNTWIEQADPQTANWSAKRDYKYWIKKWNPELPVTVISDTTITAVWESYSDVLDCPDLEFDVRANWFVDTTPGFYKKGDSCLKFTDLGGDDYVSVTVMEPGEFTFYWKAGVPKATKPKIQVDKTENGETVRRGYSAEKADEWMPVRIKVFVASADKPALIKFLPDETAFAGYLALDAVTWTPGIVPQKHTVNVSAGEHGKKVEKDPEKDEYDDGDTVTLTATAEEGYAFCCWTNDTGFATNANPWTFTVTDDVAYVATFTNCQYVVMLDSNGGTGGETSVRVTYDADLPALGALPHKDDGSSFLGYFDQTQDGTQYYKADGTGLRKWDKTNAATLYAQWKAPDMFTLTVTSAGHGSVAKEPDQTQYVSGTKVEISATPDVGYAFEKWNDESVEASRTITVTADATYTATFTARVYQVTFNANGGVQPTPKTKGVAFNAKYGTLAETTRDGYEFAGWWTEQSGGTEVTADSVFTTATDQTLYAHWDENVGELSRILDCTNLKFVEDVAGWSKYTEDFKKGDSCLRTTTQGAKISAKITTGGTLTFWWRGKATKQLSAELSVRAGSQNWSGKVTVGEQEWTQVTIENVVMDVGADRIEFSCTKSGEYLAIDFVTWTPDQTHPEPTEADKVTISSATVSDGKFSLSFKSDERFDYNLLTNANLLINSWGIMEMLVGDGNILTFEPEIIEGQPQLFYKVETIQKK